MGRIRALRLKARAVFQSYRPQIILASRMTVAAVVAFALAQAFRLHLPLWAVLTSLIATQMSVGRSLKAATDYMIGTLLGVIYGGLLAVLFPHTSEIGLVVAVALAVFPLAFIAATRTNMNVLPITALIVLLVPTVAHITPIESAIDRIFEVATGGITGVIVSFLFWPSRAHNLATDAASKTIMNMAKALKSLLAGARLGLSSDELHRIQDGLGASVTRLGVLGGEAEHERSARVATGPDTGPLLRTILRLRHDLVMIGRSVNAPMPAVIWPRLERPLADVSEAMTTYLRASAAALRARKAPPPVEPVNAALAAYANEVAAIRAEGLTRGLPGDAMERFFAIGFALVQMNQNFRDLQRVVREWMREGK